MTEQPSIQIDAELLGKIVRLLKWASDVAAADAALPDPEVARRIRDVLVQLEQLEREGRHP